MKSLLGFLQKHFLGQGQAFFRLIPLPHIFPEAHFAADQPGPLPWSHHNCLCSKERFLLLKLPVLKQNTVTGTLGVSPQTVSEGSHGVKGSQIRLLLPPAQAWLRNGYLSRLCGSTSLPLRVSC